jgi:hypothetical protein
VSGKSVLVISEGRHEMGAALNVPLNSKALPALPRLVHRLTGCPPDVTYACKSFTDVPHAHGKGHKYAKKAQQAIREAGQGGFDALAIVIDRDRRPDSRTLRPLRQGRDALAQEAFPACAIGTAVETFDAWMIADGKAAKAAGGDPAKTHPNPESLDRKEGTDKHPKDVADAVFDTEGGSGLGPMYAVVAEHVDLELLENACPQGFAPFAAEVRERIRPAVAGS